MQCQNCFMEVSCVLIKLETTYKQRWNTTEEAVKGCDRERSVTNADTRIKLDEYVLHDKIQYKRIHGRRI